MEFVLISKRVVTPEGERPAAVVVRDGKISAITEIGAAPRGIDVLDLGTSALLPGVVDTHAHINEPGRTEWEGFETATRACAAGGITTVIDMPLNSIPATTSLVALNTKRESARGKCTVDYGFWGGLVPGNANELEPMIRAGVMGFKSFLIESGVDEFRHVGEKDLREGMPILARSGAPLIVHAELDGGEAVEDPPADAHYSAYLASRPRAWENEAIRMMIRLAGETRCRTHIVHLSSADALADITRARRDGLAFSAETCPHYLTFSSEEIHDGATHFKCAPPIRESENRERLWQGLKSGNIELVVSDHSPCTPALKLMERGDFMHAWGGISSIQFSLPAVWTGARARGFTLFDIARWMSANPATLVGLSGRKGAIAVGRDADFVVFDPDAAFTVDEARVFHRHHVTPYAGQRLFGMVRMTFLRGMRVFDGGTFGPEPCGEALSGTWGIQ